MAVTVNVPSPLWPHGSGGREVTLDAGPATVSEALAALFARHPELRDRVLGETGELREHVNVFVGSESIRYTGGLDTPVAEGAELTILPAVSGG
jgi:molybdopterin converting factor small subunit